MTKKRLSNREKKQRAEIKKAMQEKGMLPPDKPKLNRKRFIEEAEEEWNNRDLACYGWSGYVMTAISYMLGHREKNYSLSREAVAAAKILKIAVRLRKFSEELRSEGKHQYSLWDQYEFIKDILDA